MLYNRNNRSRKEIKIKKTAKQKIYNKKNKDKILDLKKVYYQKNVNAIRITQHKAYYTKNAASKRYYLLPITGNVFQYVSLTDKIYTVIEQSVFQTLILSESKIGNIIKVTVRVKKIKKESTMQKLVIKFAK